MNVVNRLWLTIKYYVGEPFRDIKESKKEFFKPRLWMWISVFFFLFFVFVKQSRQMSVAFLVLILTFFYAEKVRVGEHVHWVREQEKEILTKKANEEVKS